MLSNGFFLLDRHVKYGKHSISCAGLTGSPRSYSSCRSTAVLPFLRAPFLKAAPISAIIMEWSKCCFALSLRLGSFALRDGWLLVIVSTDQYTVWASSSPSELMAAGSAAIEPWDQYIRPKMLRERERNYACARMFVRLFFWFCVRDRHIGERFHICSSAWTCFSVCI